MTASKNNDPRRTSTVSRATSGFGSRAGEIISTNKVLKNTYMLLSLTILFSAVTAVVAMHTATAPMNPILLLVGYFALLFGVNACRNNGFGVVLTFALTGLLGYSIGPLLNFYVKTFSNGSELIFMALGSTGLIFLLLSALSLNPEKDFSSMGKTLFVGMLVVFIMSLLNVFIFKLPILQLALSLIFAGISGGIIMWQTNMIVRGGERNYITATVTLYVSLFNIFLTLLQLLGMFAGNRD